jgi:hypothetical protein
MSYDLYAFRSTSPAADLSEASAFLESLEATEESGTDDWTDEDRERRDRIVAELRAHNPGLSVFEFDYAEIARLDNISEDQARAQFQHAELNPSESDLKEGRALAIQLTVQREHVFVTAPYWYKGSDVDRLFGQLLGYLQLLRKTAGYFAYDPQTENAFDPHAVTALDSSKYREVVEMMPGIVAKTDSSQKSKPWWRFW